jgi:hypothetical protein
MSVTPLQPPRSAIEFGSVRSEVETQTGELWNAALLSGEYSLRWLVNELREQTDRTLVVTTLPHASLRPLLPGNAHLLSLLPTLHQPPPQQRLAPIETRLAGAQLTKVYFYRLIPDSLGVEVLSELHSRFGVTPNVIWIADLQAYRFAPLPQGGAAQLLRRSLQSSGYRGIEMIHSAPDFIVMSAELPA